MADSKAAVVGKEEKFTPEPAKDQKPKSSDVSKGIEQVQNAVAEAQKAGFQGVKVDPFPNEAYSLESGPDSPTIPQTIAALAQQEAR